MIKLKRVLIFFIIILITGCGKTKYTTNTINYNLNIDKTYKEQIIFTLPSNAYELAEENQDEDYTSLEYLLLKEDIEPIFSNHNELYQKEINKSKENITVTLDYNYNEEDFIYSNNIMNCFENYNITSNEDSFKIDLSGEFYCLNDKILNIKITSPYNVIESNGTNIENSYTWQINTNNYKNVDINHEIKRDSENMDKNVSNENNTTKSNIWNLLKNAIGIVIAIIALILLLKFYKKQQEV